MAKRKLRTVLRIVALGCTGALIVAAGFIVNIVWFKPFNINIFYERVFLEYALMDPEMLTQMRLLEPYGLRGHNDDFTDASPAHAQKLLAKAKRDRDTLRRYDITGQTESQQLSTQVLDWFLSLSVEGEPYLFHDYPVNQLFGVQNDLPSFMAEMHQIDDRKDADQYLARLVKFGEKFDQVLEGLRLREEKGILPPRFVVERVLTEMKGFVAAPPNENILFTSLQKNLNDTDMSEADCTGITAAASQAIETGVYPAYQKLIAYFEELAPKTTTDDGVWKLPDGDAFYAYALRSQTTTDMTAEEIHRVGLSEVDRIQSEMLAILAEQGYSGKPLKELMGDLSKEDRFKYEDSEAGRIQCLADYQTIIDEIDAGLGEWFSQRPPVSVKVERIPEFKEKTAPGAYYYPPALDGSRPGIFYANLRDMSEIQKYGMRTLAYHEAIPGHHFQFVFQQAMEGPTFRKVLPFTAYAEGWALYSERLAWEAGFHSDSFSNLGRLQAELFRAVRLVVDTGIHYKRWTREQAIDYMMTNTGMPVGEVTAEIERYIVNPGQACAYKIGMIKILELREKAKTELGDAFDIKAFHDVILKNGSLPLIILESVVDKYIANANANVQTALSQAATG
ncbi:MAG: hypothetical protein AMXMBFR84_07440 [Candidatus Hydrogenedentota bacterium]